MFPNIRAEQTVLAAGMLIIVLAVVLSPVSFRVTDLGFAHHGSDLSLVGEGSRHAMAGTALHVGGCKSVAHSTICVQKEISYDHAHGLRFVASLRSRPAAGI